MKTVPLYDASQLDKLMRYWFNGSLDGITSSGHTVLGVRNCDMRGHGLHSQSLLERYTSNDLKVVIEGMARSSEPLPTYAVMVVLKHGAQKTLEDLARAMGYRDCSYAQGMLGRAQDEFMTRLLAQ